MNERRLFIDSNTLVTPLENEILEKISPPIPIPENLTYIKSELWRVFPFTIKETSLNVNFQKLPNAQKIFLICKYIKGLVPDYNVFVDYSGNPDFQNDKCKYWKITINKNVGIYCVEADLVLSFGFDYIHKDSDDMIMSITTFWPTSFEGNKELVIHAHKIPEPRDVALLF